MKIVKENKGITLIALIITIVVMLILVAVGVNFAVNSNLIGHAEKTVNATNKKEKEVLDQANLLMDKIDEIDAQAIPIPEGFEISKIPGENRIDKGLVIYKTEGEIIENWTADTNSDGVYDVQEQYDQFVWIPVENPNDMFMCQGKTADTQCDIVLIDDVPTCTKMIHTSTRTLMAGKLYATNVEENFDAELVTQIYSDDSGLREPDNLTSVNTSGVIIDKETDLTPTQSEYNNIVESVIKNKGFWVGRYETTGMENTDTADGTNIKVRAGQTEGRDTITWYRMYLQQKNYAIKNNLTVTSTMMLGAAYDQVMLTVNGKPNGATPSVAFDVTTVGAGRTESSSIETGMNVVDKVYNIYDLESGRSEWTIEAYNIDCRVIRGGNYTIHSTNSSASYRNYNYPAQDSGSLRF